MNKHSSQLLQLIRRRAGFTLHQLLDEIQLLTVSFPDLRDAFDADELPIAFILKSGSGLSTGESNHEEPVSTLEKDPAGAGGQKNGAEVIS